MKRMVICLLALCLILCACRSQQDKLYDQLTQPQSSEVPEKGSRLSSGNENGLEGELTITDIYAGNTSVGLPAMAREFMRLHPGVKIRVQGGIPGSKLGDAEAFYDFMTKTAVQLMSGEVSDMLGTLGNLTPQDCASSHLLYNLYEWMDADEDFQRDEYFQNLFQALEYDGGLYTMPITLDRKMLFLNRTLLESLDIHYDAWDTIDYKELLSISRQAEEKGLLAPDYTLEFQDLSGPYALFLDEELPDFINMAEGLSRFDSPEFIEYLEDTKSIPSSRQAGDGIVTLSGGNVLQAFSDSNAAANTSLLFKTSFLLGELTKMTNLPENVAGPFVLVSREGTSAAYLVSSLSVPTSCSNPELAWEFLKFCIAPTRIPAYFDLYRPDGAVDIVRGETPISPKNLRAYGTLHCQAQLAQQKSSNWLEDFDSATAETPLDEAFWEGYSGSIEAVTSTPEYTHSLKKTSSLSSKNFTIPHPFPPKNVPGRCSKRLRFTSGGGEGALLFMQTGIACAAPGKKVGGSHWPQSI